MERSRILVSGSLILAVRQKMKTLSFTFHPCEESHDHEVRVLIDGIDILTSVDKTSLGLDPVEFFDQPALDVGGELLIGRCGCACVGCCDTVVSSTHQDDVVVWKSDHSGLSEVRFIKVEYLESIRNGRMDTSWENLERTAERLIGKLDFSTFLDRGMVFQWASARMQPDKIALSFLRSGKQELIYVDWNHRDPQEAVSAVAKYIRNEN